MLILNKDVYKPDETNHCKAENVVNMVFEANSLCQFYGGQMCLI